MKSKLVAVLFALTAAPFAMGCGAGIEYDREPEYPQQAVGYTPANQALAPLRPEAQPQPQPAQDPALVAQQQAAPAQAQDVAIGATSDQYADTDPSALTDFHSTLDAYGTWVEDETYGTVWTPSQSVVGTDFAPYVSAGHWTYDTDYVWVSDYSWGWAPFHYGRWTYIGARGWGWIPGRSYAGAWVTWRTGYDDWGYVGWAPLPPAWYWHNGYAYGMSVRPYAPYAFCGHGDLFNSHVGGRVVTGTQVGVVAGHTRPYVPASPTVGAGGHVPAHPGVGGPPPSSMRIPTQAITPPPAGDRGLAQARAYSQPSTAQPLGARAPAQSMAHNTPPSGAAGRGPAGPVAGMRPNGATGSTGQPYAHGTTPPTSAPYSHTPPTSGYRPSTPGYRPSTPSASHPAPVYRPPTAYAPSQPHYAPSTPHYAPPAQHYAPSTPHYAPSAPHYSPPSGTYHAPSGGSTSRPSGGGGYHPSGGGSRGGGGGRGGRR